MRRRATASRFADGDHHGLTTTTLNKSLNAEFKTPAEKPAKFIFLTY